MIRARFHGRGGHGVKTASRILGSAAFRAGFEVQDFPIYGAERRGAPVVAYTRFDSKPILERGPIATPDIVVVADETLLDEPTAGVFAGAAGALALFVNATPGHGASEASGAEAGAGAGHDRRHLALDLTALAIAIHGRASALSAGLAAAAARIAAVVPEEDLAAAVREELAELGVAADEVDANESVARRVFAALPAIGPRPAAIEVASPPPLITVPFEGPVRGTPSILIPGNAALRHTGAWRLERPEIDRERCNACGLCFVRCPDGAIALDDEGYPIVDYDHCKGCLVCAQVCPLDAVRREREVRAW